MPVHHTTAQPDPLPSRLLLLHQLTDLDDQPEKHPVLMIHSSGVITGFVEHIEDTEFRVCNDRAFHRFDALTTEVQQRDQADFSHTLHSN